MALPHLVSAEDERTAIADKIRQLPNVRLPYLQHWNYDACPRHQKIGPQPDCDWQACGGDLFAHQRVGVSWAYFNGRGLLADDPGLGKTNIILALLALLKQRHELTNRAVIIVQTPGTLQWAAEARRWLRGMHVEAAVGSMTRTERTQRYMTNWDVMVIGYHVLLKDVELLQRMGPFAFVASDDVDPLLDPTNKTHRAIVGLSANAERCLTINATVLQTRLQQLHAALVPSGGLDVFGTERQFESRYVKTKEILIIRGHRRIKARKNDGVKNIPELRDKLRPLVLRRRVDEVRDVRMPKLMPPVTEWLELSPRQKRAYTELQRETLTLLREGKKVTLQAARARFMYGQMICAGMPALGEDDAPNTSPKLDWLMHRLTTVWLDRKVVVFVKNVGIVKALEARCVAQGIGVAKVWGQQQNATQREAERQRFWRDDNTRVCVGTTAIERSLNLQCANTVVALDTHLNWARMKQILGRIMRAGSRHNSVYFFTLLMSDTQEQGYEAVLAARQALNDIVFEEKTGIYRDLSSSEMMLLITDWKKAVAA